MNPKFPGEEDFLKAKKNCLIPHSVNLCGVTYSISRISPRKRNFQQNHFNLFIRGPDVFDSLNAINATKSRDTATEQLMRGRRFYKSNL